MSLEFALISMLLSNQPNEDAVMVAAALNGWATALDEIERLRMLLVDADRFLRGVALRSELGAGHIDLIEAADHIRKELAR